MASEVRWHINSPTSTAAEAVSKVAADDFKQQPPVILAPQTPLSPSSPSENSAQRGLKLVPFISLAPFSKPLQKLLGWHGLRAWNVVVLAILHFLSKLWFLLLMWKYFGWAPALAFLISMVNVYVCMLAFGLLICGPFPVPISETHTEKHTNDMRRRLWPSFFAFSVPNFSMYTAAFSYCGDGVCAGGSGRFGTCLRPLFSTLKLFPLLCSP